MNMAQTGNTISNKCICLQNSRSWNTAHGMGVEQ